MNPVRIDKYDFVVAGGGVAGISAAVSAAREGLSVLLLEKFGSLGGAMSNSLVYPFMSYRVKGVFSFPDPPAPPCSQVAVHQGV